jgi:prepilin-type processing-associated H-X9-DG protein
MYVGDFGAYPSPNDINFRSGLQSTKFQIWSDTLAPYISRPGGVYGEVYHCPGAQLRQELLDVGLSGRSLSYDINSHGVGWNHAYGLAVQTIKPDSKTFSGCKESAVVAPSQMIAFGDAVLTYGYPASTFLNPHWYFHAETERLGQEVYRNAMKRRHNRLWNIVFADGHVEKFKSRRLFGENKYNLVDEEFRRRWNRDRLPHWEELGRPSASPN